MQASSKRVSNTVIPALPLTLNTKSGNIGIPLPDIEVLTLAPESTTISSEEISEEIEINLNLDIASAMSTIKSDSLPKTYSQLLVALKHLDELLTQLY
ncbi:1075_t:CDS:2 [Gigaspora margarita]|uniref:1075_t:CDS:1 n=1 Tax=Gigaspora margarita TaxID=4874 RepID=A0ABN7VDN4_GIGMA|nr:1075_t:CDS:2 [Gigaspora margarita]